MAAPRVRCSHCGEPFDRRAANQFYCAEDDCRRARERDRKAAYRQSVAQLERARFAAWRRAAV
jgi:hypothetical protein